MPITFAQLRNDIKTESRVKGSDNLDSFINTLVNELLVSYAAKNRYLEFLKTNVEVPTIADQDAYDLPDDFSVPRLIRYRAINGFTRTINKRPAYIDTARGVLPRWYDIVGAQIKIFPIDQLPTGDSLLLDYYSIPADLEDSDPFPLPRILSTIKLEAIRRVLIFNRELQEAQVLKGDAVELEARTRPTRG